MHFPVRKFVWAARTEEYLGCINYGWDFILLKLATFAAIWADDFMPIFREIVFTFGESATNLYSADKLDVLAAIWLDRRSSLHTIKHRVSKVVHGPGFIGALLLVMNSHPFFLLYGEVVSLLRLCSFLLFCSVLLVPKILSQLRHLQRELHPLALATQGHFVFLSTVSTHDAFVSLHSPFRLLPHLHPFCGPWVYLCSVEVFSL